MSSQIVRVKWPTAYQYLTLDLDLIVEWFSATSSTVYYLTREEKNTKILAEDKAG